MASKLVCMWLMSMVVIGAIIGSEGEITCPQVTKNLLPCLGYLLGNGGGEVPPSCCNGIKTLNDAAKTTPDRQTACRCIASAAASSPRINYELAAALPEKCGVNIRYRISPNTDCSKVQ